MAKTLSKILEVYAPKSKDEKRFKDKHIVAKYKLDKPSENEDQFTSGKVKAIDRPGTNHGYNTGQDEKVYEEVHSMALHVKPVKVNGKTKYKVHAVGDHLKDGIKVGEHLSDTQLDDATEMGAKIKHLKEDTIEEKKLTPAEIKKREEVAKAIARENPKMPMAKKMAIATATAKKVAEEQSINEDEVEMDEELSELLSAIYENLSDEGKEIFEDIVENNPEKMLEFLEQLELTDGV